MPLGSLTTIVTNGHTPTRHDLSVGDIAFLTAEHIRDFKLDFTSDKRILRKHHEQLLKRTRLKNRDVLVTIKGRIGNVAVVEDLPKASNINQDVALLRLKEGIHPYYTTGFLNSWAGKMLVEHASTGQINPFLSLGSLRQIPIPFFEPERMSELGQAVQDKVHQARNAESRATELLESAKQRVERLILGD